LAIHNLKMYFEYLLQNLTFTSIIARMNRLMRALALAAGLFFCSCGSRDLKVPASPTYQSIQTLTIRQKCLQCHSSLSTYEGVLQNVTPGNPSTSLLFRQISSGNMPQWSPKLSDAEIQAVSAWIQNGAPND